MAPPVDPIDPLARFNVEHQKDWITNAATVLQFDEGFVGQSGGLDFAALSATVGGIGAQINVSRGSRVIGGGGLSSMSLTTLRGLGSKRLAGLAVPRASIGI